MLFPMMPFSVPNGTRDGLEPLGRDGWFVEQERGRIGRGEFMDFSTSPSRSYDRWIRLSTYLLKFRTPVGA